MIDRITEELEILLIFPHTVIAKEIGSLLAVVTLEFHLIFMVSKISEDKHQPCAVMFTFSSPAATVRTLTLLTEYGCVHFFSTPTTYGLEILRICKQLVKVCLSGVLHGSKSPWNANVTNSLE